MKSEWASIRARGTSVRTPLKAFVLGTFLTLGCGYDGVTRASLAPDIKVDPTLAARLKAERFTGAVLSFINTGTGTVRSRPSQARLISGDGIRPNIMSPVPVLLASMSMDLTADLMFIVQPAGGWKTPGGSSQVAFKLFWNCYIEGVDHGRIQNVTVGNITNTAIEGTGGHTGTHSPSKPFGMTNPFSGVTGADGFFPTAYTATEIAGDEAMYVDWSTSDQASQCVGFGGTDQYWHATRWEGLAPLTASAGVTFAPITSHHNAIYHAAPGMDARVHKAARAYARAFNGTNSFTVTAASLIFGGLADVRNDWSAPHQLHRTGSDVDFDGSADNHKIWDPLIEIAQRAGPFRKCEVHNKNHVHCYTTQYQRPSN